MRYIISILFLSVLFIHSVAAQESETTVEEGLASIHVGIFGSWLAYEQAIGSQFTINSQLGLEGGFAIGSSRLSSQTSNFLYILTPTLTIEPRFYYNSSKRMRKGKKTFNNSTNYVTLAAFYAPSSFSISNEDVGKQETRFSLVPMLGMRRAIGERFSFEFALGYGIGFSEQETVGFLDLDLRFGYVFYKRKK